jgi:hypothetical protein
VSGDLPGPLVNVRDHERRSRECIFFALFSSRPGIFTLVGPAVIFLRMLVEHLLSPPSLGALLAGVIVAAHPASSSSQRSSAGM